MAPKRHLAFTPASRWVTHSSAFEEQSEHTSSISILAAQEFSPSASTPSVASTPPTASSPLAAEPLPLQASKCASSSRTFYGPTSMAHVWNRQHQVVVQYDAEGIRIGEISREMHFFFGVFVRQLDIIFVEPRDWRLMDTAVRDWIWEEIWRRYDFFDHERARDVRLKKIKKLYQSYKINLYRGWLEY